MFLFRLLFLPVRIAIALVRTTLRIGFRLGGIPARVSGRAVRLVGFRGWLFLVLGVAAGLLLAPFTGRELRLKLQAMLSGGADSPTSLADKVAFELAHAPRTWHLTQPEITVRDGEVVLEGVVSDDDAREELGRVAAAIPGVATVDNRIEVTTGA
jgi:osmotically-inducible protein OsmY